MPETKRIIPPERSELEERLVAHNAEGKKVLWNDFWDWIWDEDPASAKKLAEDPSAVKGSAWWDIYIKEIAPPTLESLRKDYPGFSDDVLRIWLADPSRIPPKGTLPKGRPDPEKYGLTDNDWLVLMKLSGNAAKVQAELEKWISTGYITQYQARDIWDELGRRGIEARAIFFSTGLTITEWEAMTPEEQRAYMDKRAGGVPTTPTRPTYRGFPSTPRPKWERPEWEYGTALEEMRGEFAEEMPQTERWRDWFRSKYPLLIEQFEAQVPKKERRGERTWREWLFGPKAREDSPEYARDWGWGQGARKHEEEVLFPSQMAKLREQWYGMTPWERGERPSYFQPRIQTVSF